MKYILEDLRQLGIEQKRNKVLRDNIQSLVNNIQQNMELGFNDLLAIIIQTLESKHHKSYVHILSIIQKIIQHHQIQEEQQVMAVGFMAEMIKTIDDDTVVLKIVQTLLMMLDPQLLKFNRLQIIYKIYNIALTLINHKNIIILNTSLAAIQQCTTLYFDKFNNLVDSGQVSEQFYQNSYLLLQQFTQVVNYSEQQSYSCNSSYSQYQINNSSGFSSQQLPDWLPIKSPALYKNVLIDLLLQILQQLGSRIQGYDQLKELFIVFSQKMNSEINNCKQSGYQQKQWKQQLIRWYRSGLRTMQCFNHFQNIQVIIHYNIINFDNNDMTDNYLSVLLINEIFKDYGLLEKWIIDNTTNHSLIKQMIDLLCNDCVLINSISDCRWKVEDKTISKNIEHVYDNNIIDFDNIEIQGCHLLRLLGQVFKQLTDSLMLILKNKDIELGVGKYQQSQFQGQKAHVIKCISKFLDEIVGQVQKCLKLMLGPLSSENDCRNVMMNIQSWINITGSLGFSKQRDALLKLLTQFIVQPRCKNSNQLQMGFFTTDSIQCLKIIFNISHCMYQILDPSSWTVILILLQQLQQQIETFRQQRQQEQNGIITIRVNSDYKELISEIDILSHALQGLFNNQYKKEQLMVLIDGLNQLSLDHLMENQSQQQGQQSVQIFSLNMLEQTLKANIHSIDVFWENMSMQFVVLANCKNYDIRVHSVKVFSQFILQIFDKFFSPSQSPKISIPKKKVLKSEDKGINEKQEDDSGISMNSNEQYKFNQQDIFKLINELCRSQYNELQVILVELLNSLIENHGYQILPSSWQIIIRTIHELGDKNKRLSHKTFKITELIIQQYNQIVSHENIKVIVEIIEKALDEEMDENIHYIAVSLIWNLADCLAKIHNSRINDENNVELGFILQLWSLLFSKLEQECLIGLNREIMVSSIHTLCEILLQYGQLFSEEYWQCIMQKHIDAIIRCISMKVGSFIDKQNNGQRQSVTPSFSSTMNKTFEFQEKKENEQIDQQSKQWQDCFKILIQSLSKMNKKYYQLFNVPSESMVSVQFQQLIEILKVPILDLQYETVKQINDLMGLKAQWIIKQDGILHTIFKQIIEMMETQQTKSSEIKVMIGKIVPIVLSMIRFIWKKEQVVVIGQPIDLLPDINKVAQLCIFYPKRAQSFNSISPFKIFIDEKPMLDFVQEIQSIYEENYQQLKQLKEQDGQQQEDEEQMDKLRVFLKLQIEFYKQILDLPVVDRFNELFINKFLGFIGIIVLEDEEVGLENRKGSLMESVMNLTSLRFDNNYQLLHYNSSQCSYGPIWLTSLTVLLEQQKGRTGSCQQIVETLMDRNRKDTNILENTAHIHSYQSDYQQMQIKVMGYILALMQASQNQYHSVAELMAVYEKSLVENQNNELGRKGLEELIRVVIDGKSQLVIQQAVLILFRRFTNIIQEYIANDRMHAQLVSLKQSTDNVLFVLNSLNSLSIELPQQFYQKMCSEMYPQSHFEFAENRISSQKQSFLLIFMPVFNQLIKVKNGEIRNIVSSIYGKITTIIIGSQ